MKKKNKQGIMVLIGLVAIWWFMRPKEAKAEEVLAETTKETVPTGSAIPAGWFVAEIVPLRDELAQLKITLANLYQEFQQ